MIYVTRGQCAICGQWADIYSPDGVSSDSGTARCYESRACLERLWRLGAPEIVLEASYGSYEVLRRALVRTWWRVVRERQEVNA